MIACYDLARNPPTYDVVAFLACLEIERLRRGEAEVDLHILPGPKGGFRDDLLWPHGIEARVEMREKVLLPICEMLPSSRIAHACADRTVDGWGKDERRISLPAIVEALRAGSRPLRAPPGPCFAVQKYITFTLREAEHHKKRNSRTDEWALAARKVEQRLGIHVVIIRDTFCAHDPLDGVNPDPEAALDLHRRAAFYANARLNVGISNGPMWMAIFMDAPVLMLRPTDGSNAGGYDDEFYARHGVPRHGQLPTSPKHQRLSWREDFCDDIAHEVVHMLEDIK